MSALLPANKAQFYQGQLVSADGKNALIIAKIKGSGTDTSVAAKIEKLLDDCRRDLAANGHPYKLTATGAYRVALDNETTAKSDMQMAVTFTTLGIALLLIVAFPRPLIGLLALLPSSVGAIAALFVCSFYSNPCRSSLSVSAAPLWPLPLIWASPICFFWISRMPPTGKRWRGKSGRRSFWPS